MAIDMLAKSRDYLAMEDYWTLVAAISGGVETMRAEASTYLPQFPAESDANWTYRKDNSKFINIYSGILEGLASRPFTTEVSLAKDSDENTEFAALVEDIDGAGNHLHVFASTMFLNGLNYAVDWVLVDYPVIGEAATRADEIAAGARPIWVRIPARNMLAVYSAMIAGKEAVVYARFIVEEVLVDESGTEETVASKVRVYERRRYLDEETGKPIYGLPVWQLWQLPEGAAEWQLEDSGALSVAEIPIVAFAPGRRVDGTWQFYPPMRSIAEMQVEHYQQETNLKSAKELTAFPMFAGNGIAPPKDAAGNPAQLDVGPSAVLYAPPNVNGDAGRWEILEISASSLKFLAEEIKRTEEQMYQLGRQPLLQGSAGITQVAAALTSQQASTALQAWAFQCKDTLEQAMVFTAAWMKSSRAPSVYIDTDFQINLGDDKAPDTLLNAWDKGAISTDALRGEFKRRGVLGPDYDSDADNKKILDQVAGASGESDAFDEEVV